MQSKTKKLAIMATLTALAFIVVTLIRIPVVLFLKYDPKDVIITLGGFIWGPMTSFVTSVVVSLVEMVTISEDGFIGLIMNVLSTCAFACTAAFIYKKKRTHLGAIIGLVAGTAIMVAVMILWNYLITPIYMGYPREAVAQLLIPAFLPFNLIKGGLNAAFTLVLYKPIVKALGKTNLLPPDTMIEKKKTPVGVWLLSGAVALTCITFILTLNGII